MKTATVSLLLIILTLTPTYKARPQNFNISQSGNVRIITADGKNLIIRKKWLFSVSNHTHLWNVSGVIKCDGMICPSNSVGCNVSTKTTNDLNNIETVRRCYDSQSKFFLVSKITQFDDLIPQIINFILLSELLTLMLAILAFWKINLFFSIYRLRIFIFFFLQTGVTTKEEKSTDPNPYPGTVVSSHSDSSSTGVIQQLNHGNGHEYDVDLQSHIDSLNKQFQDWQQKFKQEMDEFNMNFHQQVHNNFQYSSL